MCLIAIHRAKIGLFDAAKGPRKASKWKSKPMKCCTIRNLNLKGLLSICLLVLLVNAEPFSGNYNLKSGGANWSNIVNISNPSVNYNLETDHLTLCNVWSYKLNWNKNWKLINTDPFSWSNNWDSLEEITT